MQHEGNKIALMRAWRTGAQGMCPRDAWYPSTRYRDYGRGFLMELLKEFCAENMARVPAAIEAGARRIELCDNLAVGGTSPSAGVIAGAVAYCRPRGVAVMAMVRPRGGDFVYTGAERDMMRLDTRLARAFGVTGVVFGCLTGDADAGYRLDDAFCAELVALAKAPLTQADALFPGAATEPVAVTFHMAFDELDAAEQLRAIDVLAGLGVERILTHGGRAGTPISANYARLRELIAYAAGRLTILPGAGITYENVDEVARELGVTECHGTKIVRIG